MKKSNGNNLHENGPPVLGTFTILIRVNNKIMNNLPLLLVFCIVTISACVKNTAPPLPDNPYGLPNATQTGEGLVACRVNGRNWIIQNHNYTSYGTSWHSSDNRKSLIVGTTIDKPVDSSMQDFQFEIISDSVIKQGVTYSFADSTKGIASILRLIYPCGPSDFGWGGGQIGYANGGSVTITKLSGKYSIPACCQWGSYDPDAIISGTFNFIIPIPNCDTIFITDGRFDINYSQY